MLRSYSAAHKWLPKEYLGAGMNKWVNKWRGKSVIHGDVRFGFQRKEKIQDDSGTRRDHRRKSWILLLFACLFVYLLKFTIIE